MTRIWLFVICLYQIGRVESDCYISNCDPGKCNKSNCRGCNDGYFLYPNGRCYDCSISNCNMCPLYTDCSSCKPNFYGSYCVNSCPGCKDGLCDKHDGRCTTECITGYYANTDEKCEKCTSICNVCENENSCTECTSGYYRVVWTGGAYCQSCPTRCAACSDFNTCTTCSQSHYWGKKCEYECTNCYDVCDSRDGCSSGCDYGFYQDYIINKVGYECKQCPQSCSSCSADDDCQECDTGYWGSYCQHSCVGCKYNSCHKSYGCRSGCSDRYFSNSSGGGTLCRACPENCGTCANTNMCYSCTRGFNGTTCQYNCTSCNGQLCEKDTGHCTFVCTSDQYFDSLRTKCIQCPTSCTTCTAANCNTCITGRWGMLCENICSGNCKTSLCNNRNGNCLDGCVYGYFGNNCSLNCLPGCKSCNSADYCTNCKVRHFHKDNLFKCDCTEEYCTVKNGDICTQCSMQGWFPKDSGCCPCSSNCKTKDCFANGTCTECSDGKYGDQCQSSCTTNCRNNLCYRDGNCVSCVDGQYSLTCNRACSYVIDKCNRCYGNNSNSVTCTRCSNGRYVEDNVCKSCNNYCRRNSWPYCHSTNGSCRFGCYQGWFGERCDSRCNVTFCHSCTGNPNVCIECRDGFYLNNNANCVECPTNCQNENICDKNNGSCLTGCMNGWSGEKCNIKCPFGCILCDQSNTTSCNVCNSGFYGDKCEKNCSSNCKSKAAEQMCNKHDGYCEQSCKDSFWGHTCENDCGAGCNGTVCNRTNGICLNGCKDDYYGDLCDVKCSENCAAVENISTRRTCNEGNGECLFGCTSGWYGETCTLKCSGQCQRRACVRNNGSCTFGCIDGYSGSTCTQGKSLTVNHAKVVTTCPNRLGDCF